MLIKRLILVVAVGGPLFFGLAVLVGSHDPNPQRDYAIAVAKQEAKARGWKWLKVESAKFQDGTWRITIWRLPQKPGGYGVFEISVETKVSHHGGS